MAIAPGLFWKTIRKGCGFDETLGRLRLLQLQPKLTERSLARWYGPE
ncbi:hypothetical protein RTCIAT899_PB02240 (plasmid) [Rhizobium tropici CIAT 899]|nr:hypothetical protein RTCIAT899_PB02240 [Rhizobium tropici CIAT 899]